MQGAVLTARAVGLALTLVGCALLVQPRLAAAQTEPASAVKEWSANGWVKPSQEALKQRLSPLQYEVTQEGGTEPAFHNQYWDNHQAGIYVDIVSGEPLFSSLDKFDSGSGWPSFTRPIDPGAVTERKERHLFTVRTEVLSSVASSHLGDVFTDGPKPTGLRYCIDSAALRFVPVDRLEAEGYGQYLALFEKDKAASSAVTDAPPPGRPLPQRGASGR